MGGARVAVLEVYKQAKRSMSAMKPLRKERLNAEHTEVSQLAA